MQWQRVTNPNWCTFARHQDIPCTDLSRRDNIASFTIGIQKQGDIGGAVGVIFQTLYLGFDTVLVATEIDNSVFLLVATTLVTAGDAALIITTT